MINDIFLNIYNPAFFTYINNPFPSFYSKTYIHIKFLLSNILCSLLYRIFLIFNYYIYFYIRY